ncbi:MAG: hypothetical protein ACKOWE_06695 [Micrococcales bacterium]
MVAPDAEQSRSGENPEGKVAALRQELLNLKAVNALEASKYETKSWFQGLGSFLIIAIFTVFGAIIGFGFLSIITGIGGFLVGVRVAAAFSGSSPKQAEYEERKARIREIEGILSQLD